MNFQALLEPVPSTALFEEPDYFVWGGSPVCDEDGVCHLLYSRWPKSVGFWAWVSHSEIAHAVADTPAGPFRPAGVALPARGPGWWDGLCTHNPTVHCFDGLYYLYYMGNTGDRRLTEDLNWSHRNRQRIGVAVARHPAGPWERFDLPLIDVTGESDAPDSLCVSNPSVTRRPDGRYLMVYKAVGRQRPLPFGGPVVHLTASGDTPTGPFRKSYQPVFTTGDSDFPAEDPCIWYQEEDAKYYAIVKDMHGVFTRAGKSLALFASDDGRDWRLPANALVSDLSFMLSDGTRLQVEALERPQVLLANGRPISLSCAVAHDAIRTRTYNIQRPLRAADNGI